MDDCHGLKLGLFWLTTRAVGVVSIKMGALTVTTVSNSRAFLQL